MTRFPRSTVSGTSTTLSPANSGSGISESELVRRGLRLIRKELEREPSAAELAGSSVGKFKQGPSDLATDRKHLEDFGR